MADFVTAVVIYCEAYSCFITLLTATKGTFADLWREYKDDEHVVDRKISCQREDAKERLSFLSEDKYLTVSWKTSVCWWKTDKDRRFKPQKHACSRGARTGFGKSS